MMHIVEIMVDPLVWQVPLGILLVAAGLFFAYCIYIGITRRMAKRRHRDPLGWILLSLLVSPLLTWIILLIAGDSKK